jgi:hypothetical protein
MVNLPAFLSLSRHASLIACSMSSVRLFGSSAIAGEGTQTLDRLGAASLVP